MKTSNMGMGIAVCALGAVAWSGTAARAATTRTWDGAGDANASGNWSDASNWSGDNVPDTGSSGGEVASLPNATSGMRTVTADAAYTIYQLAQTQSTVGATNRLVVTSVLVITNNATPLAISAAAGADTARVEVGSGATLFAYNNGGMSSYCDGTLVLAANATYKAQTPSGNNDLGVRFGPVFATGPGAAIRAYSGQWITGSMNFNRPVVVEGAGSDLLLSIPRMNQSLYFNGTPRALTVAPQARFRTDNSGGNAQSFVNGPVVLGAAARLLLNDNATAALTAGFNGLQMAANATNQLKGTTVTFNLDGTADLAPGARLLLDLSANAGSGTVTLKSGSVVTQDAATIVINLPSASISNGARKFVNRGTWLMRNGASNVLTRTANPLPGFGFGNLADNLNAGTLRMQSGSWMAFSDLRNEGAIELGTNVVFGGTQFASATTPALNNASGAVIRVTGDTLLGGPSEIALALLNNGSATAIRATVSVGDGTNAPIFTLRGGNAKLVNYAGNTLDVAAGAVLALRAYDDGAPHAFNNLYAYIQNGGTFTLAGSVRVQPNHAPDYRGIYNTGTVTIDGANAGIRRLAGTSTYYGNNSSDAMYTDLQNSAGGTLGGSGKLTYVNEAPNALVATLRVTNAGTLVPGTTTPGTLEFANARVIFSGSGLLAIDLASPIQYDQLRLSGTGAALDLSTANDVLDVRLAGRYTWEGRATFRIFEGGTVTGTFGSLRWNGLPYGNRYSVVYGANYIDVTVVAPSGTVVLVR